MKMARWQSSHFPATREFARLKGRLAEAEESLRAIRSGEVDAVVVAGPEGPQVFTLEGAGHAYRTLIESMNEGALTLTTDAVILYANQCFARMIKCPLEHVAAGSFRRFLVAGDQAALRSLLQRADQSGAKLQVRLAAVDGSVVPAQISVRLLARRGSRHAIIGMVVTDLTEARRNEGMLRALMRRVVQMQEAERGHLARELHEHITQLLCAVLFRSQALADKYAARGGPVKNETTKLHRMLAAAVEEVERISHELRPSALNQLGLEPVLHATSTEFAERTGVPVDVASRGLTARLPAEAELTLYRIFQEALKNVEHHARARHVAVRLIQKRASVQLVIKDDGIGFDPDHRPTRRKGTDHLGLLGMRERASYAGGALAIKSARRAGTVIEVRLPLAPPVAPERGRSRS